MEKPLKRPIVVLSIGIVLLFFLAVIYRNFPEPGPSRTRSPKLSVISIPRPVTHDDFEARFLLENKGSDPVEIWSWDRSIGGDGVISANMNISVLTEGGWRDHQLKTDSICWPVQIKPGRSVTLRMGLYWLIEQKLEGGQLVRVGNASCRRYTCCIYSGALRSDPFILNVIENS